LGAILCCHVRGHFYHSGDDVRLVPSLCQVNNCRKRAFA
jgi:hypothetical protein